MKLECKQEESTLKDLTEVENKQKKIITDSKRKKRQIFRDTILASIGNSYRRFGERCLHIQGSSRNAYCYVMNVERASSPETSLITIPGNFNLGAVNVLLYAADMKFLRILP